MKELNNYCYQSYWPEEKKADLVVESKETRIGFLTAEEIEPGATLLVWATNTLASLPETLRTILAKAPRPLYCKVPGSEEQVKAVVNELEKIGFSQLDLHLDMRLKPIPDLDYPEVVKSGTKQDFAALAAIDLKIFPLYHQQEDELRTKAQSEDWTVLSIDYCGSPAGLVVGNIYGPQMNNLFVRSLAVLPQYRGMGLGRKLAAALLAWGKNQGADRSMLWLSDVHNVPARRLYESLGYRGHGVEAELVLK